MGNGAVEHATHSVLRLLFFFRVENDGGRPGSYCVGRENRVSGQRE